MDYFNTSGEKWQKLLGISEKDIPGTFILEGRLNFPKAIEERGGLLSNKRKGWMPNIIIGEYKGDTIGYASAFGRPIASQFIHIYCKLGIEKVVQIGTCGAIREDIELGSLVISKEVLSLDGAAKLYCMENEVVECDADLRDRAVSLFKDRNLKYHMGKTVSYFDILLEQAEDVEELSKKGFLAIDMETAATYSVAKSFSIPAISLLVVSDNSVSGKDLFYKQSKEEEENIAKGMNAVF